MRRASPNPTFSNFITNSNTSPVCPQLQQRKFWNCRLTCNDGRVSLWKGQTAL
ncbi:MAG: hypothetical protein MUF18_06225 [Fimbriiglobus sp.]|nr:hypothetical protein [Fimbriiglobus sp.]